MHTIEPFYNWQHLYVAAQDPQSPFYGTEYSEFEFSKTIYNYYMPGRKFPILNMNYTTYQLIAGTPTTTAFIYGSNNYFTVAGLSGQSLDKSDQKFFPNPFHDRLFTNAKNLAEETEYLFYTLDTRLVLRTKSLDEETLQKIIPGIYFLQIGTASGSFYQKLIKE